MARSKEEKEHDARVDDLLDQKNTLEKALADSKRRQEEENK